MQVATVNLPSNESTAYCASNWLSASRNFHLMPKLIDTAEGTEAESSENMKAAYVAAAVIAENRPFSHFGSPHLHVPEEI